jgi:hypothetical protein
MGGEPSGQWYLSQPVRDLWCRFLQQCGDLLLTQPPAPARGEGDRIHGDKGYRGHNYANRFKVWISGQVRRVTKAIRREMRRRAAIELAIGHLKEDHRMGRNYLAGRDGDRINAVLAAAGYNFSLLLRWFEELLRALSLIFCHAVLAAPLHLTRCRKTFFTADLLRWLQKRSYPFLPFSKQETFPDSVFIHEFNAGSLQSGLDRLYGFLGNQSSLFFKIDDCR